MWFLQLLTWLAYIIQIFFVIISVAAGLYYLADLVEEYTAITKRIIFWMCIVDLIVYCCLALFENFSGLMILSGMLSQILHISILRTFPSVVITSVTFIGALILFFVNHCLAFSFFNSNLYSFSELLSYFTVCLWLVPFALFISLSANENVLPTTSEYSPLLGHDDVISNYFSRKGKKYGLLSLFKYAQETILPYQNKKSF